MSNILITGASGQLGSELTTKLRSIYGADQVLASDIREPGGATAEGPFERLDVLDNDRLAEIVDRYDISQIYHLAALLSAKAEQNISLGWKLYMGGLLNFIIFAKDRALVRIFWPSTCSDICPCVTAALPLMRHQMTC